MFTTNNKLVRKGMALAAALGMSALGLVAIGAPGASAAPAIDKNTDYKIIVTPLSGEKIKNPDGKKLTEDTTSKLIKSGDFKLEKGDYDVTTSTGYEKATKATVTTFELSNGVDDTKNGTVDADGKVKFTVKPGLYRLTQTKAPAGYKTALPSLILIPMTDPTTGSWMNEVYVYPKNGSAGKITKKDITDKDTVVKPGSEMTFEIDSPIPSLTAKDQNDKFKSYKVTDTPSGPLKVDKTNSQIKKVEIRDGASVSATLESGDYKVLDSTPYGIELTTTGLSKLDMHQGKTLRVTLTGKLAPENDDIWTKDPSQWAIKNKAAYNYDSDKGETGGSETGEDDQPNVPMAKLKINNMDGPTDLNSKNAEFSVYACQDVNSGDPSTTGDAILTGLKAGEASSQPLGARSGGLCIKQTKAPTGYELGNKIVKVEFDKNTVKTAADNKQPVEVTYENTLKSSDILSKLPLTGGAGIALFLIVAAGLLGGAYYYARRNRVRA